MYCLVPGVKPLCPADAFVIQEECDCQPISQALALLDSLLILGHVLVD